MGRHIPYGAPNTCSTACTQSPLPTQARKPFRGIFLSGKHSKAVNDIKRVSWAGGCMPVHSLPCSRGLSTHHIPNYLCQGSSQHVKRFGQRGALPGVLEKPLELSWFHRSDPHSQELLRVSQPGECTHSMGVAGMLLGEAGTASHSDIPGFGC